MYLYKYICTYRILYRYNKCTQKVSYSLVQTKYWGVPESIDRAGEAVFCVEEGFVPPLFMFLVGVVIIC